MASVFTGTGRRDNGLVGGVVAAMCIGTVAIAWIAHPGPGDHAVLARFESVAALLVAVIVSVVGAVVSFVAPAASGALRWGVALPVAVLGAMVAVLGCAALAASAGQTDIFLGVILLVGAAGMELIAAQVARRRLTSGSVGTS